MRCTIYVSYSLFTSQGKYAWNSAYIGLPFRFVPFSDFEQNTEVLTPFKIYAATILICCTWNILIQLSYLAHFTFLISSVVIVVYRNSLQTATGFRHELFTMPRFKALKGNVEALLLFWTNPCTSPANWYGRNVTTCKRSSCFALGLHNANEWYEPTEATEIAPAVFPFHVGNLTLLLRPFHLNHASRKTILCEVTGGQLMRKNVLSITSFKFLKPSSSSLFITI